MLTLKPESLELRDLYKKYEDLQEELFDPNMIIGKLFLILKIAFI